MVPRTLAAYCDPDNLLRISDVVEIIFKCAKALHYSHGRGVVHRDIKPSNIMLTTDSDVRIIDFGIALRDGSETSQINGIAGSPSYMSPEQVQGGDITHRSDIYSLGAVMYRIADRLPAAARTDTFEAAASDRLFNASANAHAPPGSVGDTGRSRPRAMQKEPEKRYKNGLDFAADLTRAFQQLQQQEDQIDQQQRFDQLRKLSFFHDFSHGEIWEVLRASDWHTYKPNEEIVREGEMDDRFYIVVAGPVKVTADRSNLGRIQTATALVKPATFAARSVRPPFVPMARSPSCASVRH